MKLEGICGIILGDTPRDIGDTKKHEILIFPKCMMAAAANASFGGASYSHAPP